MTFNPNGDFVVTSSADGTVRLWDPATGDPIGGPLTGHTADVNSVAFAPSGHLLASAGSDGLVRLWDWDVTHACEIAAKYVTRAQLQPYVPAGWEPKCSYSS